MRKLTLNGALGRMTCSTGEGTLGATTLGQLAHMDDEDVSGPWPQGNERGRRRARMELALWDTVMEAVAAGTVDMPADLDLVRVMSRVEYRELIDEERFSQWGKLLTPVERRELKEKRKHGGRAATTQ